MMTVATSESDMSVQNLNGQPNNLEGFSMGASKQVEEASPRTAYSVPGILHFIQHEWAKFELERSTWDVERAELEAKIAFLQGERKGQENLKNDLVRRIKMLEHALMQERARYHKLKYGSELSQGDLKPTVLDESQENPMEGDQLITPSSNVSWRQGRQLLRQYLHEIGYTDTVIDVRSNRVRSLLGLKDNNAEGAPMASNEVMPPSSEVHSKEVSQNQADLLAEDMLREAEQAVLANCDFLSEGGVDVDDVDDDEEDWKSEEINTGSEDKLVDSDERDSSNMAMALKSLDFNFANISMRSMVNPWDSTKDSRAKSEEVSGLPRPSGGTRTNPSHYSVEGTEEGLEMGLGELAQLTVTNESESGYTSTAAKEPFSKMWNAKYTLRSHFDGVRALAFHPIEPVLVTASEDHTLKLWSLLRTTAAKKSTFLDVEPIYTFRGHVGAVLAIIMNPTGEQCYSGGLDGSVRVWNLPNSNIDPYDAYDTDVLAQTLSDHTDAVWGLAFHTQKTRLLSCSTDGTAKLWSPGSKAPLLNSYSFDSSLGLPSSIDFVHEDCSQMVVAYTSGRAAIYDLETSKLVLELESGRTAGDQINCVVSHPTMPLTMAAHEDRHVRFYDNVTGKVMHAMVAHQDAVTSLAVDPTGLYLLSGSHDCSVRLWNLENKQCVQEITAHRKKCDESIHCVGFHPTKPFIASGGADALVKVFV